VSTDPASEPEDVFVGRSAERVFAITEAAVRAFAEVSGDHNPVHLDEAYAARTVFRGRVAHGMLLGAHISAVLGDKLPGPGSIYLSQTLSFEGPVRIGDDVRVRIEVMSIDDNSRHVGLSTLCTVGDKPVARGEAVVIPPRRRRARAI
jgi:3-hydroxybutyryl-CoA dehydratase